MQEVKLPDEKTLQKKESLDLLLSEVELKLANLSKQEIQLLADYTISQMHDKKKERETQSPVLDGYFGVEHLEPKKKVIRQQEFSQGVKIAGYLMLALCVYYWIHFFFIIGDITALTYTTYLTIILISLTCINKFESVLLNSATSITAFGFSMITVWLIPVANNPAMIIVGPILHGIMATFQWYLIFHPKIPMSKRYLIWGYLFVMIFMGIVDQVERLNIMTGNQYMFTSTETGTFLFYIISLTVVGTYFYKKHYGILLA